MVEQCHHETQNRPQDEPCKFCGKQFPTWKKLTVHLAKHMEHIALPVLALVMAKEVNDATRMPSDNPPDRFGSFLSDQVPKPITPYNFDMALDEQPLYLGIGIGGSRGLSPPPSDLVVESPTSAKFNIYDTAYQEEIDRIRAAQGHQATVYLTRRVDEKKDKTDENMVDPPHAVQGKDGLPRQGFEGLLDKTKEKGEEGHVNVPYDPPEFGQYYGTRYNPFDYSRNIYSEMSSSVFCPDPSQVVLSNLDHVVSATSTSTSTNIEVHQLMMYPTSGATPCQRIRNWIYEGLSSNSPVPPGQLLHASFNIDWDICTFIQYQYEKNLDSIGTVITLSGTAIHAQAAICSEYVETNWPVNGTNVINSIETALQSQDKISKCMSTFHFSPSCCIFFFYAI